MRTVGIILAGGKSERLGELTSVRATCAMPVGSCYRAIDFTLSNMSNSGIKKVAVITQYNSRSLHDHLSSAKWWDFGRKQGGLFVFTPFGASDTSYWFRGTADSIYQNISFLKRSNEQYVVIASGDGVYKMDYNDIIDYHVQKDADITIACRTMPDDSDVRDFGVIELDDDMRMIDFEEKPIEPQSSLISIGIYVISRILLIKLLETIVMEARYDFVRDIICRYRKKLKMYGYMYGGYWSSINCVQKYYETNMDFLKKEIRDTFLGRQPYIETKPKDEPPAKYNRGSQARNCLVGSGSILNGYISGSVLFRKVFTGENSVIKDSIIMEGCYIGNNCVLENAILDKDVIISDGKRIVGSKDKPQILRKYSLQ
jgi:glucose-1-phosphate adenylyltransferase